MEYLRGEAPAVLIPALITTTSIRALLAPPVLEAVAVFAVLYLSGFIVNALADRDLDVKYDSFKREIGEATARMGARRMRAVLAAHLIVALTLALHLSITMGAPELFAMAAIGTFLAMAYSLPPLHLKVRGVAAHAVALSLSAFAIPFLFLYGVAAGQVDVLGWGICAAFTLTHYGLTYTNQAYDYDLDLKEGVRTPPVRLGLRRSLVAAGVMTGAGLVALTFGVVSLALSRPALSAAWGVNGALALAVATPCLLWLGYHVPLRGLTRMLAVVRAAPTEQEAVPEMRKAVHYANFHAAGIGALAAFAVLFFAATVQAGAMLEAEAAESLSFAGDPAVDSAASMASFSIVIHNGGAHALPASTVNVLIELSATNTDAPFAHQLVRLSFEVAAGATVRFEVDGPGLPTTLVPSLYRATFVLGVDANRDGFDIRETDRAVVPF